MDIDEGEHLTAYFVHGGTLIERELFRRVGFGKAVTADHLQVHGAN
jgi:hypothetical protein